MSYIIVAYFAFGAGLVVSTGLEDTAQERDPPSFTDIIIGILAWPMLLLALWDGAREEGDR